MNEYTVIGIVVAAFILAGVLSYFFTPPVKRFAHKVGAIDVPKDNRFRVLAALRFSAAFFAPFWYSASWTRPCCAYCSVRRLL